MPSISRSGRTAFVFEKTSNFEPTRQTILARFAELRISFADLLNDIKKYNQMQEKFVPRCWFVNMINEKRDYKRFTAEAANLAI